MLFTGSLITDCPIRQKIREFYRIDENIAVDHIQNAFWLLIVYLVQRLTDDLVVEVEC